MKETFINSRREICFVVGALSTPAPGGIAMASRRRGQAALEFLTTYGWAIMVVLVMIGALAYFGVLNPTKYIPSKCLFTTGLTCVDYVAEHNDGDLQVRFILENGLGTAITIDAAGVGTYDGIAADCENETVYPYTIGTGERRLFTCGPFGAGTSPGVGQRAKVAVTMNYTEVGGAFVHPVAGEVQTTVQ